jgi:predicted DNA-binding transcriptional regulator AlpA
MSDIEVLIPDPAVAKEFGITLMTIWRWDNDPKKIALGWPPKVQLGKRNYRHRSQLEVFKSNLLQRALAGRELASSA